MVIILTLILATNLLCSGLESVYFASTGGAADAWPEFMGLYLQVDGEELHEQVLYTQCSDGELQDRWLYYGGGHWRIGYYMNGDYGFIRTVNKGERIPEHDW